MIGKKRVSTVLQTFKSRLFILVVAIAGSTASFSASAANEVPVYGAHEISLTSTNPYSNKYTDVTLTGTFQGPGRSITIPGFWDGGNTWKIRMAPTTAGDWTLTDVSSNDSQLNNQKEGTVFRARTPTSSDIANNEVLRHGFIRVSKNYPHSFEHADGMPFFLMGDTQWERACINTDGLDFNGDMDFQAYQDDRVAKGFSAASMAWIGSKGSSDGAKWPNEGGYPFSGSHTDEVLRPEFFQALDNRIDYMTRQGMRPMLVLGSQDSGLTGDLAWIDRYTRYLVARYAAYDVIWYGFKEYQEYGGGGTAQVDAFGNAVESTDPYNHPTSTHPLDGNSGTSPLDNRAWLDFHTLQNRTISSSIYNFGKPVVITEAWYEGNGASTWSYTPDKLLGSQGIWVASLNGGYNAGYEYWAAPRGNTAEIFANMNTISIQYQTHLRDFFANRTSFQKLVPHDELIVSGSAEVMAQEINESGVITGKEYVAYLAAGGSIKIDLSQATGTLNVEWFNPKTGVASNQTSTTGNGNVTFTAPSSGPWVLHLTESGAADTTAPAAAGSLQVQ